MAVLLEMMERAFRRVDGDMGEVRTAEPLQLGIEIGEVAALQQRIVGEVDARRHVLGHERDLLGLGEEIVRHPVQHQPADRDRRQHFFRDQLGRIEHIEFETIGECLIEQLELELPFRKIAGLDGGPQIAAMEVRIGAVDLDRLVPQHRLHAELRLPVKLDESRFVLRIDQAEGVDAKAFHEAERASEAETARVLNRQVEAMRLYEESIDAAAAQHYLQEEALAYELGARFHADGD